MHTEREYICRQELTCYDDLSSYRGEVLLIDRTDVQSARLIVDIPADNYTYGKLFFTFD